MRCRRLRFARGFRVAMSNRRSQAAAMEPASAKPESKAKGQGKARPGAAVTGKAYGDDDVPF